MIQLEYIEVAYGKNRPVLTLESLRIARGERVAIIGPSGAGKSTLLRSLKGYVQPRRGKVEVLGVNLTSAGRRERVAVKQRIALIYQQFHLVRRLTVLQNTLCGRLGHTNRWRSLLGLFNSEDKRIAWVLKLNRYGDTLWTRYYQHPMYGTEANRHIVELINGDLFFILRVVGGPNPGAAGVRTDSAGNILVTAPCMNSESFYETSDGGIVCFGTNLIGKYNSNLTLQWIRHCGGLSDYWAGNGIRTNDNGYFLFALTTQFASGGPSDYDWLGVKLDSAGNVQWEKVYGTIRFENLGSVQQTFDGGFIMCGLTTPNMSNPSNTDVLVIKTDANGNVQWTKTYGGPIEEQAHSIRQTPGSPGYIIAGTTFGNELVFGGQRGFVYKLDLSGNFQWGKFYGSMNTADGGRDEIQSAYQVFDGGYVMSGQTENLGQNNQFDFWVIKTDNLGVSGCNEINTIPQITTPSIITSSITANDIPGTWITQTFGYSNIPVISTTLCSNNIPTTLNESPTIETTLLLYPNPNQGIFSLSLSPEMYDGRVVIFNALSQIVYSRKGPFENNKIELDPALGNGIYFLVISDNEKKITGKFILQRKY